MKQLFKGWDPNLRMMVFGKEMPGFIDETEMHPLNVANVILKGVVPSKYGNFEHQYQLLKYINLKDMQDRKLYANDVVTMPIEIGEELEERIYIIEDVPGGYIFRDLKTGEAINALEYGYDHAQENKALELTTLIGNAKTHPDILEQFGYSPLEPLNHQYRAYWTYRKEYYRASDLSSRYYTAPFVTNEVNVVNEILNGKYTPTLKVVPFTGVCDMNVKPIYDKDVIRNLETDEAFVVYEMAGGFILKSVTTATLIPLASFFCDRAGDTNTLENYVLLGTLYEAEKLYEEHGMSTYGFNHM